MSPDEFPDLSDKLVLLYLKSCGKDGSNLELLEYCQWRQIAGRQFLVGRNPNLPGVLWAPGKECGVAWDFVESFVLFRDTSEYEEAAGNAEKLRKAKRKWLAV